ncbi:MAG: lasso RiPP family leader peptide-containing protein [Caldilineaceae bacterium]|jgi:hypothetical protein
MQEELNFSQVGLPKPEALAPTTPQTPPQPAQPPLGNFVPPRLTKQGKVAALTQGGFGGSLPFP